MEEKTVKRQWLEEAYRIFSGDKNIKPKVEHVNAAMETLIGFSKDAENLRNLMRKAYDEAAQRRKENDLPIPPMPISLQRKVDLPWKN